MTSFDKTILVQKLMAVDSQLDVEKYIRTWIRNRKKIHEPYRKIKDIKSMEDYTAIKLVAEWAFNTKKVVFIDTNGIDSISLEDWKVI